MKGDTPAPAQHYGPESRPLSGGGRCRSESRSPAVARHHVASEESPAEAALFFADALDLFSRLQFAGASARASLGWRLASSRTTTAGASRLLGAARSLASEAVTPT